MDNLNGAGGKTSLDVAFTALNNKNVSNNWSILVTSTKAL